MLSELLAAVVVSQTLSILAHPVVYISTSAEQVLSLNVTEVTSIFEQYVSRYEGDLVAKCYFAKHKLVWEVLEGGLKSKIEIQWSDITALKATCPENGHGTLDVVVRVSEITSFLTPLSSLPVFMF